MEKKASSHACLHRWFKGHEIAKQLGDAQVRTFRLIYGTGFAPAFCASQILRETLAMLDKSSLDKLLMDGKSGQLENKIAHALAQQGLCDNESSTGSDIPQPI
jgi:hypothetical protein